MSAVDTLRAALFGNPPDPNHEPSREGTLAAFAELYNAVLSISLDALSYATVSDLPSSVDVAPVGTSARVYNDPDPANNVYWIRKNDSGANNGWEIDADLIDAVTTLVQPLVDETVDAAQIAQSLLNAATSALAEFGVPDTLDTAAGRTILRADGTSPSPTVITVTDDGIALNSNSANSARVMSTIGLLLETGRASRLELKHRGTILSANQYRAGLGFGEAGSRTHVMIAGNGSLYTIDDTSATQQVLSTDAKLAYATNEIVTSQYYWDGENMQVTVITPNGSVGPHNVPGVTAGPVWITHMTNGTVEYLTPLKLETLPLIAQDKFQSQSAEIAAAIAKSEQALAAASLTGVTVDLSDPSVAVFTVPNGGSVGNNTSASYSEADGGLKMVTTTSTGRNIVFPTGLNIRNEGGVTRTSAKWQIQSKEGTSAFYHGISIGIPGLGRRHYVYTDNGGIVVYADDESVIYTTGSDPSRAYTVGDIVDFNIDIVDRNGNAVIRASVNGVTKYLITMSGVPNGPAFLNARTSPIVTSLITHVSSMGYNELVKDAIEGANNVAGATLTETVLLPDSENAPNVTGGFTCTGLDQIPAGSKLAGCWLIGNHGQSTEGGTVNPYASSVLLFSPDCREIFREWEMSAAYGTESIQGVCCGHTGQDFWIVDKHPTDPTASRIMNFTYANGDGTARLPRTLNITEVVENRILITDLMAAPDFQLNGIARGPASEGPSGSLWVSREGQQRIDLVAIGTGAIIRSIIGTDGYLDNADQLCYDEQTDLLGMSYGGNGNDGYVRFYRGATGSFVGEVGPLSLAQAIEGIKVDLRGLLVVTSDGAYHRAANPPLALILSYKFSI